MAVNGGGCCGDVVDDGCGCGDGDNVDDDDAQQQPSPATTLHLLHSASGS